MPGRTADPTLVTLNGLNGASGGYLWPPMTGADLGKIVAELDLDEELLQLVRDWSTGMSVRDALRAPSIDVTDPGDLAQTGWGVIFAATTPQPVRDALQPLLTRRSQQAGGRYRELTASRGVTRRSFFTELQMKAGTVVNADSVPYLPYYLLLVGDPSEISFRFQSELDVQYAVGRLHLSTPEAYGAYVQALLAAEDAPDDASRREPNLTFFTVRNSGDTATAQTSKDLVAQLEEVLKPSRSSWKMKTVAGASSTRDQLRSLLGGPETPAILFTASHGVGFPFKDPRQSKEQGALVCAEWPGPSEPIRRAHYFTAEDLSPAANLQGTIVFHFACYSAGTPKLDEFERRALGRPAQIAEEPFIARLPQSLLEKGALAVIGHVDRTWTSSFSWNGNGGHVQLYNDVLKLLTDGLPLGWAMERMGAHSGDQALALQGYWEDRTALGDWDYQDFSDLWRATQDVKNFMVLGDPAVRIRVKGDPR